MRATLPNVVADLGEGPLSRVADPLCGAHKRRGRTQHSRPGKHHAAARGPVGGTSTLSPSTAVAGSLGVRAVLSTPASMKSSYESAVVAATWQRVQ